MQNLKNALLLKNLYQLKWLGYNYSNMNISQGDSSSLILPMSLETLKEQAIKCQLCDLSKSRDRVLFGEGDVDADIIFVGDAPTIAEESSGGLFIGNSGEILTNMINRVLLINRSDVYITNILKCHISNQQPPTPTQIHTCLPYIKRELEIIKPSIVVALGSSVYEYLTGESRDLSEIRGVIKREEGYSIVATYHPSYLLRNPSIKREAFEDMKFIRSLMESTITLPPTTYTSS